MPYGGGFRVLGFTARQSKDSGLRLIRVIFNMLETFVLEEYDLLAETILLLALGNTLRKQVLITISAGECKLARYRRCSFQISQHHEGIHSLLPMNNYAYSSGLLLGNLNYFTALGKPYLLLYICICI